LKEPYPIVPVVVAPIAEDVLEKRVARKDAVQNAPPLALNLCNTCQKPGHRERDCLEKDCTNELVQNRSLPATSRPLPPRYICNRCNIPGHWREDCLNPAEVGAGGGVYRDGAKMRDGQEYIPTTERAGKIQNLEHLHQKQELQPLPWLPSAQIPPTANMVYKYIYTYTPTYT